ncbi:MAG: hypothetical protein IJI40_08575 [Firmicutes bacterium]|nr:hypothetical protein [Bacillota bacterium]
MTDLTEQDIFTAFGLEQPTEPAAPAVGPADQGGESSTSSAEADELASSAQAPNIAAADNQQASSQEQSSDEADAEEPVSDKPEQSVEERRANAARRREKERKEAVDRAVAAEREKAEAEKRDAIDAVYRKLGYEGEADYQRKQAEEQAELRAKALRRMGLSEEEGNVLFPNTPTQPQEYSPQADIPQSGQSQTDQAEEPFQGGYDALERQLMEISKLDPSIKTLEDLRAKPWCEDMAKALNARQFGTDEGRLLRAYKVFAQEDIINARLADARKAGRQEALNQQAGKEHLAPARDRTGAGLPEVPKETLTAYQQLMPGLTYEQYQKEYARTLKATK